MKLISGLILLFIGVSWLTWISLRKKNRREIIQTIFDFFTGSPAESIIVIGIILFGLIMILAHFLT